MRLKILTCLIVLTLCISAHAQIFSNYNKPRLTVIISIDGLQNEHIAAFWDTFEQGGFKQIIGNGFYTPNAYCNYLPNGKAVDYASLYTGTIPYYHGIIGDKLYSIIENKAISIVQDNNYHGIGTDWGASPKNIVTTTIVDELKLSDTRSQVYAIGLHAEESVMMGGHLADGVMWLDDNGRIASSDYYKKLPIWAEQYNNVSLERLFRLKWRPLHALRTYLSPPEKEQQEKGEDYTFYSPDINKPLTELVTNFRGTPRANTLIKDLALLALKEEGLGNDNATDMLCLQFTAQPLGQTTAEFLMAEKEDLYLNLDKDLALLFAEINKTVGMNNTLIVITGNQTEARTAQSLANNRINSGQFNARRAMALLNSFLMAKYGQGQWVNNYYARQITLNDLLFDKYELKAADVESDVIAFLSNFQGIHAAYSMGQLMTATGSQYDLLVRMRNSYFKHRSGNIFFTLMPGWTEVNDKNEPIGVAGRTEIYLPVAIAGINIPTNHFSENISFIDITPTLCRLMQIPLPNGCIGKSITLK